MTLVKKAGTIALAIPLDTAGTGEGRSREQADAADALWNMAANFVHWPQAFVQLRPHFLFDTPEGLRKRYGKKLAEIHGLDPRVEQVFDVDVRLLYTSGGWADAITRQPQKLVRRTLERLPALLDPVQTSSGPVLRPNPCRVERALSGIAPAGYEAIRIVRGASLRPEPDRIEIPAPHSGARVELLNGDCLPLQEAFNRLGRDLPGVSRQYLTAALAAAICADSAKGQPPILMISGPTGAAKDQTLRLAASFLADRVQDVTTKGEEEAHWRRLAGYCNGGHRFVHIPEVAREENPRRLVRLLLKMTEEITWRPQHGNDDRQTPNWAAYFLSGIAVPSAFAQSAEVRRRVRLVRLTQRVPIDWGEALAERYGHQVGVSEWRSLSEENALIANSVLTHAYLLCQFHRFYFPAVADALELLSIDEDDVEAQNEWCRALYRHCRGETPGRRMHDQGRWEVGDWVDATAPTCWRILEQLTTGDEDVSNKRGREHLFYRLRSLDWPKMLGIDRPPICFEAATHGKACAIRFRDATKMKKGDGIFNEDLPPIGDGMTG